jgi:hypothetical protein
MPGDRHRLRQPVHQIDRPALRPVRQQQGYTGGDRHAQMHAVRHQPLGHGAKRRIVLQLTKVERSRRVEHHMGLAGAQERGGGDILAERGQKARAGRGTLRQQDHRGPRSCRADLADIHRPAHRCRGLRCDIRALGRRLSRRRSGSGHRSRRRLGRGGRKVFSQHRQNGREFWRGRQFRRSGLKSTGLQGVDMRRFLRRTGGIRGAGRALRHIHHQPFVEAPDMRVRVRRQVDRNFAAAAFETKHATAVGTGARNRPCPADPDF